MYKIFFSFVFIFVFNFFTFGDSWRVVNFSYSDGVFPIDHSLGQFPEGVYIISCEFQCLPSFSADLASTSMVGSNLNSVQGAGSVIGYVEDFFPSTRTFSSSTGWGYFETRFTLSDSQSLPVFLSVYVPACTSGVIHIIRTSIGGGTEPVPPGTDPDNPGTGGGGGTTDPDNPGTGGGGGTTDPDNPDDPENPDDPDDPENPDDPDDPDHPDNPGNPDNPDDPDDPDDSDDDKKVDVNFGGNKGEPDSLGEAPTLPFNLSSSFGRDFSVGIGSYSLPSFSIPYVGGAILTTISISPNSFIASSFSSVVSFIRSISYLFVTFLFFWLSLKLFRKNS